MSNSKQNITLNEQVLDYSFGMPMPGRSYTSENYRFGFNGMEKDDEWKDEGNSLDFGARIYESRLGSFLSLDAHSKDFPYESNYAFVSNSPLIYKDPDGNRKVIVTTVINKDGSKATFRVVNHNKLYRANLNTTLHTADRWVSGIGFDGTYSYERTFEITIDYRDNPDGDITNHPSSITDIYVSNTFTRDYGIVFTSAIFEGTNGVETDIPFDQLDFMDIDIFLDLVGGMANKSAEYMKKAGRFFKSISPQIEKFGKGIQATDMVVEGTERVQSVTENVKKEVSGFTCSHANCQGKEFDFSKWDKHTGEKDTTYSTTESDEVNK